MGSNPSVTLDTLQTSSWDTGSSYAPVYISAEYEETSTLAASKLFVPSSGEYDARFIVHAFRTELVDTSAPQQRGVPLNNLDVIQLDSNVAMDFLTVYGELNSLKNYDASKIPAAFNRFDKVLAQHEELYAVAKVPLGDVVMGEPLVFDPSQYDIDVPDTWLGEYKVGLVVFAINILDRLDDVAQINVSIALPKDCIAIDLMPLIYTGELETSQDTETPRSVLISTILGGGVAYQRGLKPVIEAYGLQRSAFGWKLRGEALGFGPTRVAALVRTPRALTRVDMESAFNFEGPDSWIAEGGIGSSDPEVHVISF